MKGRVGDMEGMEWVAGMGWMTGMGGEPEGVAGPLPTCREGVNDE
jgi:hypothetical protein